MTMPKWHETMRPILAALDNATGYLKGPDLIEAVACAFDMAEEERAERLNSGQPRLYNRTYWGITDLEKAKLLEYGNARGTYRITDAGRTFLATHGGPITAKDLYDGCPAFRAWKAEQASPQEAMESAHAEIRDALADELISAIMGKDPFFFEHLVARVLVAMGYGEGVSERAQVTQKSGDSGIDGVVKEDRLGFDAIYYQAKRWDPSRIVGRPDVQAFVGALSGKGASKGLFITTSSFSDAAREYAEGLRGQKVVLVDGRALAGLMIDCNVGVSTRAVYEVKAIDADFFEEA